MAAYFASVSARPTPLQRPVPLSGASLLRGALALTFISLLGFGLLYCLASVGLGQALFPQAANGGLIERDARVVGSALVAQPFTAAHYFHPRPSAANYDVMALAGSNQARSNPALGQRIEQARASLAQTHGVDPKAIPDDLLTQSGSGIDPHISVAAAAIQIGRVAQARGVARETIEAVLARHTQDRQFGILGQPRVNVLELNLAMDASTARRPMASHESP